VGEIAPYFFTPNLSLSLVFSSFSFPPLSLLPFPPTFVSTEIEIPADIDIPQDDADVDAGEAEAARKEEQKWADLDLEVFRS
jgi:hypothetical protein